MFHLFRTIIHVLWLARIRSLKMDIWYLMSCCPIKVVLVRLFSRFSSVSILMEHLSFKKVHIYFVNLHCSQFTETFFKLNIMINFWSFDLTLSWSSSLVMWSDVYKHHIFDSALIGKHLPEIESGKIKFNRIAFNSPKTYVATEWFICFLSR